MTDPQMILTATAAALIGLGIATFATLRAWRGWLELKRLEIDGGSRRAPAAGPKRELSELKERVRKLEAIASGVEI